MKILDSNKLSSILYSNKLDVKKFENLLSNNDQGYKFFWLEAILKLIAQNKVDFCFEDVIDEMILNAWRMVTHYHLRLGHTVNGNAENFLEHAIRVLYECSKDELGNKTPSRDRLMLLIRKYQRELSEDKLHLTDYVPYRLIKPFVEKEGKEYIDRKNYGRFIAYLNAFTKINNEFFYDIIDADNPLNRRICLNEEWVNFIVQNYAVIMGWLRFNKALFIQDRNPGVPGIMYKVVPETEEKHKSLKNARELWIATVAVTGKPLYEIYTGQELSIGKFDLDHFVPRSFVSNDELWNLTPMAKNLNSSKNNRLPEKTFIKDFVEYNYYLYRLIFDNCNKGQARTLRHYFERCENQHLNAIWAAEKLYIPGNTKEQFSNLLEENLSLVYDSARLQEYEMWVM